MPVAERLLAFTHGRGAFGARELRPGHRRAGRMWRRRPAEIRRWPSLRPGRLRRSARSEWRWAHRHSRSGPRDETAGERNVLFVNVLRALRPAGRADDKQRDIGCQAGSFDRPRAGGDAARSDCLRRADPQCDANGRTGGDRQHLLARHSHHRRHRPVRVRPGRRLSPGAGQHRWLAASEGRSLALGAAEPPSPTAAFDNVNGTLSSVVAALSGIGPTASGAGTLATLVFVAVALDRPTSSSRTFSCSIRRRPKSISTPRWQDR